MRHIECWSTCKGMSKREYAVRPPWSSHAAVPLEATASAISSEQQVLVSKALKIRSFQFLQGHRRKIGLERCSCHVQLRLLRQTLCVRWSLEVYCRSGPIATRAQIVSCSLIRHGCPGWKSTINLHIRIVAICFRQSKLFKIGKRCWKTAQVVFNFQKSRVIDDVWKIQVHVLQLDPSYEQNLLPQVIASLQPRLERLSWFTKAHDNQKELTKRNGILIGNGFA